MLLLFDDGLDPTRGTVRCCLQRRRGLTLPMLYRKTIQRTLSATLQRGPSVSYEEESAVATRTSPASSVTPLVIRLSEVAYCSSDRVVCVSQSAPQRSVRASEALARVAVARFFSLSRAIEDRLLADDATREVVQTKSPTAGGALSMRS